jgi:hypothetical protein
MPAVIDSSLRELGLPIDIPDVEILCPRCRKLVAKGVLGIGGRMQLRCRNRGCKGENGKALLFPIVSLDGGT